MARTEKKFRWISFPGLLILMVGCAIIDGDDDDDEEQEPPAPIMYVITADVLNVRERPSIAANVVAKAASGTVVQVTHQAGGWYGMLMSDGSTGWAASDFFEPAR